MNYFKNLSFVVVCFLVFTILFSFQAGNATPVVSETQPSTSTISVTGTADVMVVPDEVVITLGIDTRNKDIVQARKESDENVQRIVNLTKQFKIDSQYVQTDYIDIRPGDITGKSMYETYEKISPANQGYIVRKKMVITLKDLSKFENFIAEVVKTGAEYVNGVEFRTSELRKHKDKARELAVKAAKEKAVAMSKVLGQKAGKAINIVEQQEYYYSWYNSWYSGFYRNNSVSSMSNSIYTVQPEEQQDISGLAPGQIKVSANVSIDFSLE